MDFLSVGFVSKYLAKCVGITTIWRSALVYSASHSLTNERRIVLSIQAYLFHSFRIVLRHVSNQQQSKWWKWRRSEWVGVAFDKFCPLSIRTVLYSNIVSPLWLHRQVARLTHMFFFCGFSELFRGKLMAYIVRVRFHLSKNSLFICVLYSRQCAYKVQHFFPSRK